MEKQRLAWQQACNQVANQAMDSGAINGTDEDVAVGLLAFTFYALLVLFDLVGDKSMEFCTTYATLVKRNWEELHQ